MMKYQTNTRVGVVTLASLALLLTQSSLLYANNEFNQWKRQQQQSFQDYKDKRDKEFTAFLKMHWTEMQLLRGVERDPQPKPVRMPVAPPEPVKPVKPVPVQPAPSATPVVVAPVPEPGLVPKKIIPPVKPPLVVPAPAVIKGQRIELDYFGSKLTLYYDPALQAVLGSPVNENTISDFWSALSLADYDGLIGQLEAQRGALQLNDWAYFVLINQLAQKMYPGFLNQQTLFTWFVLAKSDYVARIAYDNRAVYLLVPSNQQIYSVPYFTFDQVRYYAVRFDGNDQTLGKVYTYDGQYPGTHKQLDMLLNHDMVLSDKPAQRKLSFVYAGKPYTINAAYSREQVAFLKTYPQLDLDMYFDANVSSVTASPLLMQLSADMRSMDQQQAVNFLLKFVQTSLQYKTDEDQFGKENYLFPEETLYYPYSDCEDRAVLFAWLVKKLLALEVVGLDYPGHVATAVHFTDQVNGDAIMFQDKRYVITDPTYVNAIAGMTMPEYKNTKPSIIKVQ